MSLRTVRLAATLLAVTLLAACSGMQSPPPSGAAAMQNQNRSY